MRFTRAVTSLLWSTPKSWLKISRGSSRRTGNLDISTSSSNSLTRKLVVDCIASDRKTRQVNNRGGKGQQVGELGSWKPATAATLGK